MVAFSRYYPFDSFKLFYYFSRIVGFRAFYLYHILMPDKFKNYLNLISLLIIIFFAASIVWYSPVLFKGYSTMNLWNTSLLARNLAGAGVFGVEDNLNIVLASSLLKQRLFLLLSIFFCLLTGGPVLIISAFMKSVFFSFPYFFFSFSWERKTIL